MSLRLLRSFATTSPCRNSQLPTTPSLPRRKGRIPPPDPTTQSLLPPEKQRALISLYHLSEKLITPENLDKRIVDAFQHPRSIPEDISQSLLDSTLKQQRAATKMSIWNMDPAVSSTQTGDLMWSSNMSGREAQIVDALCGTETIGRTLPGYGTLMEARRESKTRGVESYLHKSTPKT